MRNTTDVVEAIGIKASTESLDTISDKDETEYINYMTENTGIDISSQ